MSFFQSRYQENALLLNICKYIVDIIMVITIAYVLVQFTCTRATVNGNSMEGIILNDNTVLINKISYAFNGPQRYDIIAFGQDSLDSSKVYIKRVIGLPGEKVQIINGIVYINGNELSDDVSKDYILTPGFAANEIVLGDDEYFVLGDNRNNSEDSRFASIGLVKSKNIIGEVWMVIAPINKMHFVK